jgi:hypothetical protein
MSPITPKLTVGAMIERTQDKLQLEHVTRTGGLDRVSRIQRVESGLVLGLRRPFPRAVFSAGRDRDAYLKSIDPESVARISRPSSRIRSLRVHHQGTAPGEDLIDLAPRPASR